MKQGLCEGNKDENAVEQVTLWTKAKCIASGRNKRDCFTFLQHSKSFAWFINSPLNKPFHVNES